VFDIQQGVAIIIAVKTKSSKAEKTAAIFGHSELWGNRKVKYDGLWSGKRELAFSDSTPHEPYYGFEPWDYRSQSKYESGVNVRDLFLEGGTGVVTKRDKLTIHRSKEKVWQAVQDMLTLEESAVRRKYDLPDDVRDWRYEWAVRDLKDGPSPNKIQPISYRPFDQRFIYFTGQSRGFVGWPVEKLMRHFVSGGNIGLATARSNKNPTPDHFFITNVMMETKFAESSTQSAVFPLYLYPAESELDQTRRVNMDPKIRKAIENAAEDKAHGRPDEVAIFDYVYGVLHCPAYRETYREFLKSISRAFPIRPRRKCSGTCPPKARSCAACT
jgi:Type ISP C-terminal specificity domain